MSNVRTRSGIRTTVVPILTTSVLALGLAGCAGGSATLDRAYANVDGAYVKVAETSGISSACIIEGDSATYVNGSCDRYSLHREAGVLSEDLTRITDPGTGENYVLTWYEDRTGFVWDDHGDFIRDDSTVGKSAVERWEATCGADWLG